MDSNENIRLTAEAWTEIIIKIWKDKIQKKRRKRPLSTDELLISLVGTVYTNSGGDVERILFAFNYYGLFVDMGVGRGVKYDELEGMRGTGQTRRRKKSWFSGTFDFQVEKLTIILEEKYGLKIASAIVDTLDS